MLHVKHTKKKQKVVYNFLTELVSAEVDFMLNVGKIVGQLRISYKFAVGSHVAIDNLLVLGVL